MKNIFRILSIGVMLFIFTACENEDVLTALKPVGFTTTPESSVSTVVVTPENMETNVISFSWTEVTYPVEAPVSYTLEFALPADTIGANAWQNAQVKIVGDDVTIASLTGLELNDIAVTLGMNPLVEGTIVVRVRSYLDRPAYSKAIDVKVTPYKEASAELPKLYIAGDYQGWNIGNPTAIASMNSDNIYEGYIYVTGSTLEFKLYAQPDWGPMSYGDGGDGTVIVANFAGANFKASSEGYYFFAVNLTDMTYLLIKTSWGIIGGATPNNWDSSTDMTYDVANQIWTITADMKADGTFKFRANNAWQIDFGIDADGHLAYANHPWLAYVDQPQLTVPSDGNYTIKLDLHNPGIYTYSIKKN